VYEQFSRQAYTRPETRPTRSCGYQFEVRPKRSTRRVQRLGILVISSLANSHQSLFLLSTVIA
jgi:hypothetical protein